VTKVKGKPTRILRIPVSEKSWPGYGYWLNDQWCTTFYNPFDIDWELVNQLEDLRKAQEPAKW
jgi:hypothetical protein